VARSFFSRLVRGGGSAPLAPPRPVSNLWKRAQIDAAAAGPRTESLSASGGFTIQPSRTADPAQPLKPAEVESWPAPQLSSVKPAQSASRARAPKTSVPIETLRPSPAAAVSPKIETAPQDAAQRAEHGQPDPVPDPREPTVRSLGSRPAGLPSDVAEIPNRRFASAISSAPPVSSRGELLAQPPTPSPSLRPIEAKPIPTEARRPDQLQPNPRVARPAAAAADRQSIRLSGRATQDDAADGARATSPFPVRAPITEAPGRAQPPQSRLPSVGLAAPIRARETSLATRQSSAPEAPRAKENTVQIGKIEVQVVPPPTSNYRPAPPSPPKARLARGYALWPGW
jgi:hypothetical protein